ncbi:MAG: hypothetical protein ACM3QU_08545 [Verrucomicrobiota bacterium]
MSGRRRRRGLAAVLAAAVAVVAMVELGDAAAPGQAVGVFPAPSQPIAALGGLGSGRGAPASPSRSAGVTWVGGPTVAGTGETVMVYVSTSLPPESGTPQTWADYFAGLLHGPELSSLTVYIASYEEVQELCARQDVVGCYGGGRLTTIGESLPWVDRGEVASHEYGHHVAANRNNDPWQAVNWGAKRWATAANVCARTAGGSAFPGDQGERYRLNPGEGFAEVFRVMNEAKRGSTSFKWQTVDPSFYPSQAALQAAERDVVDPWTAPAATTVRGAFVPRGKKIWTLRVATPLDGRLTLRLVLPATRPYGLSLVSADGKTVLANGLWSSAKEKTLTFTICGQRSVLVRVSLGGPAGRFSLVTKKP